MQENLHGTGVSWEPSRCACKLPGQMLGDALHSWDTLEWWISFGKIIWKEKGKALGYHAHHF